MLSFFRRLLPPHIPKTSDLNDPSHLETGPDPDPIAPIGYEFWPGEHMNAIPWNAQPRGYDGWFNGYYCAAAHKDGQSILIFPSHFMYEDPITGECVYNVMGWRCDDKDSKERLAETVQIYHRLFEREDEVVSHPRIVKWMGSTNSGYRLERLRPGPIPSKAEGLGLRLYWRWAMQILAALAFLHERGVRMGSFSEDHLWLREDFSIAVACLLGAGCEALGIEVGDFEVPIESPWHGDGGVKADLVDWANVVFGWMVGDGEEVLCFEREEEKAMARLDEDSSMSKQWQEAYRYRGELVGFRRLEKERLGDVIVDVLIGKHETAEEVLEQVRKTVQECSGAICGELMDDVDEFEKPEDVFEVVKKDQGWGRELRVRSVQQDRKLDEKR